MDQLWGIALRAQSADISRAAIQYINSYYINGQDDFFTSKLPVLLSDSDLNSLLPCVSAAGKTGLEKEQEFIRKCMESLLMASANLEKDSHSSLTSIERGLLMLKTHLEAFRRRYIGVTSIVCEGDVPPSHKKNKKFVWTPPPNTHIYHKIFVQPALFLFL